MRVPNSRSWGTEGEASRFCTGYHLPRKTGSGNASVKNSINSTHLQRFCNALEKKGKTKGFDESSVTTINALNDTIVNRKKLYVSNFIKKNEKIHSIGSAQSQMLELSEEWQTEDTPYDYDNPGAGGGGGGYLLDTVVGNALALVPVPVPAPSHQVEDGGAIILVVGDGDGGGGPGAGGGVLPIDRVLSVYRIMLGWQNPFNFIPRFQFSLNLDIVRGVHEVEHLIRGAYTSLFLNTGFLVPDHFICTYLLDFGEGGVQAMASEHAMALTW
ncbi:uncharacterized protein LOC103942305 [Pyrus x bretschneideri]|uniref:uncharacterized protein LOC103942305 n=1 Tax=Pyrus x bretschneideri TaxID=225117 RepID=UPI00202FF74E|nr:uncharacterized protein LOC103942305 [Pyrus x bretschneideri]